ncbi:hypothetical protein [Raoultibacter phocaeensis]|uniref:hypothetical protein n=1 Tax=Raoultibacter phocaeensis TaxID=2479841 RepID=UPI0011185A6B|nr:hypothetical protein [Raoultibacter phocaeensis]
MKTAKELEEMFGIASDRIEKIDEDASKGILQGSVVKTVTGPGRPPLFDEPMQQVAFKEPRGRVRAIDARAAQLGLARSDYLRQLVENDLECAGMA